MVGFWWKEGGKKSHIDGDVKGVVCYKKLKKGEKNTRQAELENSGELKGGLD